MSWPEQCPEREEHRNCYCECVMQLQHGIVEPAAAARDMAGISASEQHQYYCFTRQWEHYDNI